MNKKLISLLSLLIILTFSSLAKAQDQLSIATIRILDKITAQSHLKDIKIGNNYEHGDLIIKIHKCWNAPLDQKPETKMLVEVIDKNKEDKIFLGWLFASSPSISAIEHPIYDITSINCK